VSADPALTWDPPPGAVQRPDLSPETKLVVNAIVFARLQRDAGSEADDGR